MQQEQTPYFSNTKLSSLEEKRVEMKYHTEKEEKRVSEVPLKEKRNKWKLILEEKLKLDTTE